VKFDLIVATLGRTAELECLMESLVVQTHREFRVVVVDQNGDGRLEPILKRYQHRLELVRVESAPGLSRARNAGLRVSSADVVSFPDDDCRYPPDLLARVAELLEGNTGFDGVTGRTVDATSRSTFLLWQKERSLVARRNVWRTAVAVTIFLRHHVIERIGEFDETLGAGSGTRWQSGEETDYALRALEAGFTVAYEPTLCVFHDSPNPPWAAASAAKGYGIGLGNSRVLRRYGYSPRFAAYRVCQVVAGSAFSLVTGRFGAARFYWAMARGRAAGWLEPPGDA
jgi:glycosyltransferase involved in cell wall biosynthesis